MFVKTSLGGDRIVPEVIRKVKQSIQELHDTYKPKPIDQFFIDDRVAKEILEVLLSSAAVQAAGAECESRYTWVGSMKEGKLRTLRDTILATSPQTRKFSCTMADKLPRKLCAFSFLCSQCTLHIFSEPPKSRH